MDLLTNLALGATTALSPINLAYCFLGVFLGTAIGVLPGVGPLATIAMLLPITYKMSDPSTALIMLAGIYYGAQYGGSTTSILINVPGEASSAVTALDGHRMARQGRAGLALATAALASFFAGTVATGLVAAFAPPLSRLALEFGPADYFSLMVLGLIAAVVLAQGSVVKAIGMVVLGLILSLIGTDVHTGLNRFTFGIPELVDGISFGVMAIGMFGVAEVIYNLRQKEDRDLLHAKIEPSPISREEQKRAMIAAMRGTILGSLLGVIPGGGALIASFAAYAVEKKASRDPSKFGQGAIEGVAAPEAANNAAAQTSFVPLLTMGIPTNPLMALMIAAMIIHNIQPGPQVMTENPSLFWGVIVSMWVGNLMLVILNLPLIGIWVRMLRIRYQYLYPAILLFCCVGAYSLNFNVWDVFMLVPFAVAGFYFKKWRCEPAPLLMGFILGELMESHLRRALLVSQGDWMIFLERPISLTLLIIVASLLAFSIASKIRTRLLG